MRITQSLSSHFNTFFFFKLLLQSLFGTTTFYFNLIDIIFKRCYSYVSETVAPSTHFCMYRSGLSEIKLNSKLYLILMKSNEITFYSEQSETVLQWRNEGKTDCGFLAVFFVKG